jgi:poly(3-hydroxybutyrate) depolymerase
MRAHRGFALTLWLLACAGCASDDDAGDGSPKSDAAAECVHSPYNGLEPACSFAPGPGNGQTEPAADALPKATGVCPDFADGAGCIAENGALTCTFKPAGQAERQVRVWMPPGDRSGPGPLIFYYYGLLGWPDNAVTPFSGFTTEALDLLRQAGGMLVAPQARADRLPPKLSRLPWIGALGLEDDQGDFELVDEVVACAMEKIGIDVGRIHVTGLSAGGWMTAQVAVQRSNYIASAALFSGGLEALPDTPDPDNKYAVAMFHGGPGDNVGAHFENEAQSGVNLWRTHGHFAVSCNHGGGHSVPGTAALAGMRFMLDHRYGTLDSPYCESAPPEVQFCSLTSAATGGVQPATGRSDDEVATCVGGATSAGLIGGRLTEDMLACACQRCSTELEACLADPSCLAGLHCAVEKGCLGISCHQDALCAPIIDAAGGPGGESPQRAVAFSDCIGAAACDECGVPDTR